MDKLINQAGKSLRGAIAAFTTALIASVALAPNTFACGFHSEATLMVGLLNHVYPKSLYVRTAVWQAEDSGVLPRRSRESSKNLFAYHRTAAQLKSLENVTPMSSGDAAYPFAILLLDSVLWTRVTPSDDRYSVSVHVNGPAEDDVVVVTHGKVIGALLDGSLGAATAEAHGLVRFYGPADRQDIVRRALAGIVVPVNTGRSVQTESVN